ncbi:MAG TPA: hypothetical protein VIH99_13285 [Bdellovibrionota bacterium]|jgi:hypothetical protein
MKFKYGAMVFLLLFVGCAPKSIDSYHTAENEEETVRLLNDREYAKAIWLLESRHGKIPTDRNVAFLLGQAYLGKAGFEPLLVAAEVSRAQDFSSPDGRDLLPDCPTAAVNSFKGTEPLCLLKRVYLHIPDPDSVEFSRARQLFRAAYPRAEDSPEWVNVLIGAVETASCVRRAGSIYLLAKRSVGASRNPSDAELGALVQNAVKAVDEASQALQRAKHGGKGISQLLTGNRETVWFEQVKNGVEWADRLGLGNFFDLLRANLLNPADETRYGETLDKIRKLLDEQEKLVAGH